MSADADVADAVIKQQHAVIVQQQALIDEQRRVIERLHRAQRLLPPPPPTTLHPLIRRAITSHLVPDPDEFDLIVCSRVSTARDAGGRERLRKLRVSNLELLQRRMLWGSTTNEPRMREAYSYADAMSTSYEFTMERLGAAQIPLFGTIDACVRAGRPVLLLIRSIDGLCRTENLISFFSYWRRRGAVMFIQIYQRFHQNNEIHRHRFAADDMQYSEIMNGKISAVMNADDFITATPSGQQAAYLDLLTKITDSKPREDSSWKNGNRNSLQRGHYNT
ncbi:unnamed protein product [Zymoseptoria tritici ST99CH_1E4]|uniref:Uncharacterized protein n=1 Tax=Zymoseptoria tritici ST99CH_1E4 TaxID=1276532 RepID=A0A2H1H432_ZYMTR|nr:unnamed protein product [Zymoseptoria tritici ST99CH_1E4]